MGDHINKDGEFQSDKYPSCPAGKVPLSTKDPMAQDLIALYACRRIVVDSEFYDDLRTALINKGFNFDDFCAREEARQAILATIIDKLKLDLAFMGGAIVFNRSEADELRADVRAALGKK